MHDSADRIFPKRLTDLWMTRGNGQADVLGDSDLYLNHYQLDETGAFIWGLCNGTRSVLDLAKALTEECGSSAPPLDVVISDTWELLQDLKAKRLLDWQKPSHCDVLLLSPPFPTTYHHNALKAPEFLTPPIGLAYLAAYLREHGYKVIIQDLHISAGGPERIIPICKALQPRLIGITATTPTYPNALRASRYIKAWNQDVPLVLGGVHATGLPETCLQESPFDYIALGEGEATLLALCQHILDQDQSGGQGIEGLAWRNEFGKVVINRPRPPIQNLDALPFPARDLLEIDKYVKKGAICTSRGCPNGCSFCACHLVFGMRYRTPSISRIAEELEMLSSTYGVTEIDFNDDTFNWQPSRVFDLCKTIEDRHLNLRWSCFCRAAEMTPEMARVMKRAGCGAVQFGVESGSPQILDSIGKRITLRQVEIAVEACAKAGIEAIVCGIMLGHPQDTPETIGHTLDFAEYLLGKGATRIMLSLLTPYPGTQVYRQAQSYGMKILTTDWEQYIFSRLVVETKNLPKEVLRRLYVEGLLRFLKLDGLHRLSGQDLRVADL
jgi:anaerobic magnesium-protoporphyrin IX monomethyl ester cyclase